MSFLTPIIESSLDRPPSLSHTSQGSLITSRKRHFVSEGIDEAWEGVFDLQNLPDPEAVSWDTRCLLPDFFSQETGKTASAAAGFFGNPISDSIDSSELFNPAANEEMTTTAKSTEQPYLFLEEDCADFEKSTIGVSPRGNEGRSFASLEYRVQSAMGVSAPHFDSAGLRTFEKRGRDSKFLGQPEVSSSISYNPMSLRRNASKPSLEDALVSLSSKGLLSTPQHEIWASENPNYTIGLARALFKEMSEKKNSSQFARQAPFGKLMDKMILNFNDLDCGTEKDFVLGLFFLIDSKHYLGNVDISQVSPRSVPYFKKIFIDFDIVVIKNHVIDVSRVFPILHRYSLDNLDNIKWFVDNVHFSSQVIELLEALEKRFPITQTVLDTVCQHKYKEHLEWLIKRISGLPENQKNLSPDSFQIDLEALLLNRGIDGALGKAQFGEEEVPFKRTEAAFDRAFESLGKANLLIDAENCEWAKMNPRYAIALAEALPLLKYGKSSRQVLLAVICKVFRRFDESDCEIIKDFILGLSFLNTRISLGLALCHDPLIANPRILPWFAKIFNKPRSSINLFQFNKAIQMFETNPASFEADFKAFLAKEDKAPSFGGLKKRARKGL